MTATELIDQVRRLVAKNPQAERVTISPEDYFELDTWSRARRLEDPDFISPTDFNMLLGLRIEIRSGAVPEVSS